MKNPFGTEEELERIIKLNQESFGGEPFFLEEDQPEALQVCSVCEGTGIAPKENPKFIRET